MLDASTKPTSTDEVSRSVGNIRSETMTDGYGEDTSSGRTLGGDVDFFSSLGTERKRGKAPEEKLVRALICTFSYCN